MLSRHAEKGCILLHNVSSINLASGVMTSFALKLPQRRVIGNYEWMVSEDAVLREPREYFLQADFPITNAEEIWRRGGWGGCRAYVLLLRAWVYHPTSQSVDSLSAAFRTRCAIPERKRARPGARGDSVRYFLVGLGCVGAMAPGVMAPCNMVSKTSN
jgi:hypothetical protein